MNANGIRQSQKAKQANPGRYTDKHRFRDLETHGFLLPSLFHRPAGFQTHTQSKKKHALPHNYTLTYTHTEVQDTRALRVCITGGEVAALTSPASLRVSVRLTPPQRYCERNGYPLPLISHTHTFSLFFDTGLMFFSKIAHEGEQRD